MGIVSDIKRDVAGVAADLPFGTKVTRQAAYGAETLNDRGESVAEGRRMGHRKSRRAVGNAIGFAAL